MTDYFDRLKGGTTIYYGSEGVSDVRLILMHYGEDPDRVISAFWAERKGDFLVAPIVAYGAVPRRELCSQQSLVDALRTVRIEPGSTIEMKWKELCEQMAVAWPKRLTAAA